MSKGGSSAGCRGKDALGPRAPVPRLSPAAGQGPCADTPRLWHGARRQQLCLRLQRALSGDNMWGETGLAFTVVSVIAWIRGSPEFQFRLHQLCDLDASVHCSGCQLPSPSQRSDKGSHGGSWGNEVMVGQGYFGLPGTANLFTVGQVIRTFN